MFTVKYGDDYLTDYVRFLTIDRGIASENIVNTEDSASDGVQIIYTKRDKKDIATTFHMIDGLDVNVVRRKLAAILSTTTPKRLIFSDESNFYYDAIVSGKIDFTDDGTKADGGVTFTIADIVAKSVDTKTLSLDNSGEENGTVTINGDYSVKLSINNHGTAPAFPLFKIKNVVENGLVRIVSQYGTVEIGKRDEVDGVTLIKSELLLNAINNVASDFENFIASTLEHALGNPDRPNNGTVSYQTDGLRLANVGTGTGWHQGSRIFTIPEDSNGETGATSFITDFNAVFETASTKELGYLHIMLTDADDNVIMGYAISKTTTSNNGCVVNFYYRDINNVGSFLSYWKRPEFEANGVNESLNPVFYHTNGHAEMTKQGAQIGWLYDNKKWTMNIPELENVAVKKIHFEFGAYGTTPRINNMSLRRIWFQKTNVEKWSDIPNRFIAGSEIDTDMSAGKISLDGAPAMDQKIDGSTFFSIQTGTTDVYFYPSTWVTTPLNVEAQWEERNL